MKKECLLVQDNIQVENAVRGIVKPKLEHFECRLKIISVAPISYPIVDHDCLTSRRLKYCSHDYHTQHMSIVWTQCMYIIWMSVYAHVHPVGGQNSTEQSECNLDTFILYTMQYCNLKEKEKTTLFCNVQPHIYRECSSLSCM